MLDGGGLSLCFLIRLGTPGGPGMTGGLLALCLRLLTNQGDEFGAITTTIAFRIY